MTRLGIDLTLAGHTHGGQLYVSRGIGTTMFPIRIGARPEITVLEPSRTDLVVATTVLKVAAIRAHALLKAPGAVAKALGAAIVLAAEFTWAYYGQAGSNPKGYSPQ